MIAEIGFIALYGIFAILLSAVPVNAQENETLPEHEFLVERQKFVKKGAIPKHHVSLIIGAYTFKRKQKAKCIGKNAVFVCNECSKTEAKKHTSALVKKVSDTGTSADFQLVSFSTDHACLPSRILPLKKKFIDIMYKKTKENPSAAFGKIYLEERRKLSEELSEEEKDEFFQIIPSEANLATNLCKFKREFVPQAPKTQSEFDTKSSWMNLKSGESIVKEDEDENTENSRIILLATNFTLRLLARAVAISCDGTFKMRPTNWWQLFIVCAQLTDNIWIPCAFGFLPDKKEKTYTTFFVKLKDAMSKIDESLSATYVMCDFELGIRKSLKKVWPDLKVKGCHFHMAKAIWKRVVDAGLKNAYSDRENKKNDFLVALIVGAIGMAYVPLERLEVLIFRIIDYFYLILFFFFIFRLFYFFHEVNF